MERQRWDVRAKRYEDPLMGVFSLTKYPEVIKKILGRIEAGPVLDLGCGPTGRMLNMLSSQGYVAHGVDLSLKMIRATRRSGFRGKLLCADTRCLAERMWGGTYNTVVSLNSIVPPERDDAQAMLYSAYHVLAPNGLLIAIVMSSEYHERVLKEFPGAFQMDSATDRVWDEEGYQCSFSKRTIIAELRTAGFSEMLIEPLIFDRPEMFDDVENLYGIRLPTHLPLEEWFVVARK